MRTEYPITPVAKPRQTRRDKWLDPPRPAVERYRVFCTLCKLNKMEIPVYGAHVIFILPMPASWSEKKKAQVDGQGHQSRPDLDNCIKSLWDALYKNDSAIFHIEAEKRWGREGRIIIEW